eukprot:746676-Hanusia_phi.AAC.13
MLKKDAHLEKLRSVHADTGTLAYNLSRVNKVLKGALWERFVRLNQDRNRKTCLMHRGEGAAEGAHLLLGAVLAAL